MTKFPKRALRSFRRSESSGSKPTYEIIRNLKKSSSNGPAADRVKKKILRRIVRRGAKMDTEDLLKNLTPFANIEKRINDEPLDRSDDSEWLEATDKLVIPTNRIQKPRVYSRAKTNNSGVKFLKYNSNRAHIVTPCFDDEIIFNTPDDLRHMYHQGVKEEDCDSTDSVIQMGIEKAMRYLLIAMNSPTIKRKAHRFGRSLETLEEESTNDYTLRLRTRANTPLASAKLLESRSSVYGSDRNIAINKH